ncbi:MAG TPA: amidohydrolase family protein [Streptosporangiaceae bacterium]
MASGPGLRLSVGQLVTDPRLPPVRGGALLAGDGQILAAGPEPAVPRPPGAAELAFPGCTALPGLIDSHVHLTLSAGPDCLAVLESETDEQLVERGLANARRMAAAGITTVADLGARGQAGFEIARRAAAGPPFARVLAAGAPITPSRGHTCFFGGEADGAAGVAAAVRDRVERGAAIIKIIATGGAMTAGTDPLAASYPVPVLAAAAREARLLGRPVTAHAHGTAGIRAALAAGLDAVEHATMLGAGGDWEFDAALAAGIAAAGMRVIPTAAAGRRYERTGGAWTAALPNRATGSDTRTRNAGALLRSGVTLVAGTDAGIAHTDFGDELFTELEAYVSVGMNPAAAIGAATTSAAAHLRLEASTGTLAPGRAADVLIVEGDPLSDITALRRTRLVLRAGQQVGPVPPPAEPP